MEQKLESGAKTGEIKFVIKSIFPITSDFTAVIKNSNDSTDNLLEFRSLMTNSIKVDAKSGENVENNNKSYSADVKSFIQKILSREKSSDEDSKNDSGQTDSSGSMSDVVITKKQKINDSNGSPAAFAKMSSSTPIKLTDRNAQLDISGVGYLSFVGDEKCAKSSSLNDSDFESMDQDQYDESLKKKDEDLTLISSETSNDNKENMSVISRTSSLSDFRNGFLMILEETMRRTPMALRKAFNMDSNPGTPTNSTKSKFLNIFSSTKKSKRKQSSSKKRPNRRSGSGKKKYPLTKENLQKFLHDEGDDKDNVEWGDNFDYSFICEPALSDVGETEDSSNYVSYNTSLDSSIEMLKSPLVPTFKIEPPTDTSSLGSSLTMIPRSDSGPLACDYVKHMIKCSYASRLPLSTSFRRSMSEPAFDDALETDGDSTEFAFSQANTTKTCEASIKNLTQLSVSIFSYNFSFSRWFASRLTL